MYPDFNKKTVETVAKKAAYKCSNPDCRVSTVGPNSDPNKSTLIGEAAHIYGARRNSKRYRDEMTDSARAEITNAIWLCRNCHKLIDTDEIKYSSNLLFAWRETHEKFVQQELGNATDKLIFQIDDSDLSILKNCPPIIRRIVIDKPEGWEWSLTAELMRYFNSPVIQQLNDLHDGLYVRPLEQVCEEEIFSWVDLRLSEISSLANPLEGLFERLTKSWGALGESGNVEKIYHICSLISDYLKGILEIEEKIYFVKVNSEFIGLVELLKGYSKSLIEQIADFPKYLDETLAQVLNDKEITAENPAKITKTITFQLPKNWEKKFSRELKKVNRNSNKSYEQPQKYEGGCFQVIIWAVVIFIIFIIFF